MPSDGNSIRFYYQLAFRESIHELNDEAVSHLSIFVRLFNANIGFEQYPMATAEFGLRPLVYKGYKSVYSENTGATETLDLARTWLHECVQLHPSCKQSSSPSYFPSRVLAVGDTEDSGWRLYITEDDGNPHEPYATLSHCWGGTVPLTLTTTSLHSLRHSQSIARLPQTFRDAVRVARFLQIRYLWIDALCIVQDSREDWGKESSRMADIYRNGLCNIAASRAANSHGGFFAKGDLALFEPPAVVPKWEGCSGMQYELCHLDSFGAQYRKQPLHCRAWYVQEHILGPRQISFAGQELLWHCRERTASEIWPTSVPYIVNDSTVHLFGASFPHNNSSFQELFEDWRAILNEYSMSALTRPEDKLVAISGIVRIIQQATGMSYWAGIWDHDLTRQLLWAANGNNVRPQQYRAPSWSWASLDGKIDSGWNHGGDTLTAWSRQSIVQFLEIKVTPVHQDMTGQISAAFIRLRGPLFQVLSFDNKREHATVSILSKYYAYTDVHFDTAEQFSATDLLCLPLRKEPRSRTDSGIAGLIVLNRGRLNEYERLGTFKLMSEEAYRALGLDQQNPGLDSTTPNVENYDIVLV